MLEIEIKYEKLSKVEAKKLHNLMRAKHGNVRLTALATGLSINTLRRAKGLLEITAENAEAIREFLSGDLEALQN